MCFKGGFNWRHKQQFILKNIITKIKGIVEDRIIRQQMRHFICWTIIERQCSRRCASVLIQKQHLEKEQSAQQHGISIKIMTCWGQTLYQTECISEERDLDVSTQKWKFFQLHSTFSHLVKMIVRCLAHSRLTKPSFH